MPIILRFYLDFVLRNKLFVEKDINRGYEKALAIAKRAELDLLATFKVSRALPDEWGRACKAFWGQLYYTLFEQAYKNETWPKVNEWKAESEDFKVADQPKLVAVEYDLGEKQIKEEAPKVLPSVKEHELEDAVIQEVEDDAAVAETVTPDAIYTPDGSNDAVDDGWGPKYEQGPISERDSPTDLAEEWRVPKADAEEDVWGTYVEATLFSFIGPSEFPTRRIPIRIEKSTRVLVGILPPEPASSSIVSSRLATLVLQPWPTADGDPDSLVTFPQMIDFWEEDEANHGLKNESAKLARAFDSAKDEMRVHVDPKVVTECRLGMGIGAIWVQVGKRADIEGGSGSTKRKKYSGDEWWYMERLEFVIPSYWTVNDARLDMTRTGNNPDFAYNDSD